MSLKKVSKVTGVVKKIYSYSKQLKTCENNLKISHEYQDKLQDDVRTCQRTRNNILYDLDICRNLNYGLEKKNRQLKLAVSSYSEMDNRYKNQISNLETRLNDSLEQEKALTSSLGLTESLTNRVLEYTRELETINNIYEKADKAHQCEDMLNGVAMMLNVTGNHKMGTVVSGLGSAFHGYARSLVTTGFMSAFSLVTGFAGLAGAVLSCFGSDDSMYEAMMEQIQQIAKQLSIQMQAYHEANMKCFEKIFTDLKQAEYERLEYYLFGKTQRLYIQQDMKKGFENIRASSLDTKSIMANLTQQLDSNSNKILKQLSTLKIDRLRVIVNKADHLLKYDNIDIKQYKVIVSELMGFFDTYSFPREESSQVYLFHSLPETNKKLPVPYFWNIIGITIVKLMAKLTESEEKSSVVLNTDKEILIRFSKYGKDLQLEYKKIATVLLPKYLKRYEKNIRDLEKYFYSERKKFNDKIMVDINKARNRYLEEVKSKVSSCGVPNFYNPPEWNYSVAQMYALNYKQTRHHGGWERNHYPRHQSCFLGPTKINNVGNIRATGRSIIAYWKQYPNVRWPKIGDEQLTCKGGTTIINKKVEDFNNLKSSTLKELKIPQVNFDVFKSIPKVSDPMTKVAVNSTAGTMFIPLKRTLNINQLFYDMETLGLGEIRYSYNFPSKNTLVISAYISYSGKTFTLAKGTVDLSGIHPEDNNERVFYVVNDARYCGAKENVFVTIRYYLGKYSYQTLCTLKYPPYEPKRALINNAEIKEEKVSTQNFENIIKTHITKLRQQFVKEISTNLRLVTNTHMKRLRETYSFIKTCYTLLEEKMPLAIPSPDIKVTNETFPLAFNSSNIKTSKIIPNFVSTNIFSTMMGKISADESIGKSINKSIKALFEMLNKK